MSSNFIFNRIDIVNNKHLDKIESYKKTNKKDKNYFENSVNSINVKKSHSLKNKKILINLEKSYKSSLELLEIIKKQAEKNIFKKYNIEQNNKTSINRNEEIIQNTFMKKKFLITPFHISLMMK